MKKLGNTTDTKPNNESPANNNLEIVNKVEEKTESKPILRQTDSKEPTNQTDPTHMVKTLIIALVIVIAGTVTGFGLSKVNGKGGGNSTAQAIQSAQNAAENGLNKGDIFGSQDEKTFSDKTEGVLEAGGFEGEGSHKLLRPGGDDQTVYLTSSIMDLDQFADHKVKVWGKTYKGQSVGWLMDVGRLEIIELDAEKPATDQE